MMTTPKLKRRIQMGVVISLLLFLIQASAAQADSPTSDKPWAQGVSAEDQAKALRLFDEGNSTFSERSYAAALRSYKEAIKHWDHPAIRFNMSECYIHLDQPVQAFHYLKKALAYGEAPLGDAIYQRALTNEKLLSGQIAYLEVSSIEPGAQVTLDGVPLILSERSVTRVIGPGRHQIVAKKDGYRTLTNDLVLVAGETVTIEIKLAKLMTITAAPLVRRWPRYKPWALAGGGTVLAAAGLWLQFRARANTNTFDQYVNNQCPSGCIDNEFPDNIAGARDAAESQDIVSVGMLGVGVSALVAGITLVVFNQPRRLEKKHPSATPVSFVPFSSSESVGLAAVGRW